MSEISCPNPDCRVAETGKCVEGFKIGDCPHQNLNNSNDFEESVVDDEEFETIDESNEIAIYSGNTLDIEEATTIMAQRKTCVINVIGPTNAGKTTFGISLYDSFQNGCFDIWNFCGSMTLYAFEQRCHNARANSGRTTPDTPHTPLGEGLSFLHLSLYSNVYDRVDLLISDRSGEFYKRVANNLEEGSDLCEVYRADYILFFIDGQKLSSDDRHAVKNDFMILAETLIEKNVLGSMHRVGIVLTKYDIVVASEHKKRIETDFINITTQFTQRFGNCLQSVKSYKISTRPENENLDPMHGVAELLRDCVQERQYSSHSTSSKIESKRIFQNLEN